VLATARTPARLLFSLLSVAAVTGAVFALRPVAPVLSLGVLYVFAVLPVAVLWGLAYALSVSLLSMLTFNFLFLPPLHTLALRDSENWVALAVYLVTAVVVSELATRSRRRGAAALEAETLRRSDAVKTAVLRAVSHDLRSPLTAIAAASEVLDGGADRLTADERAELVASVRLETRRLVRLVGNLLDLSRLEAGAAAPRRELWTVDSLVARSLEAIGPDADRVEVSLPADSPLLHIDAGQIERVLVNLLENALRVSSPAEPVEITTEVDNGMVVLRVLDRGPGLEPEAAERIFEPFERGVAAGGGAGLGLAIAKGFAQANGGRVWAESRLPGRGAAFALALPARAEQ
jgi:K+-sensing histidine kinase KdpD